MGAFTTNDFATLLDEVIAAGDVREVSVRPSIPRDLLNAALSGPTINAADAADYIFAETAGIAPLLKQQPMPARLSADPAEIARELGLTGKETVAGLDRVRRAFAFANHPDRVAEDCRPVAIVRMQIANRLIDDAKARRA